MGLEHSMNIIIKILIGYYMKHIAIFLNHSSIKGQLPISCQALRSKASDWWKAMRPALNSLGHT